MSKPEQIISCDWGTTSFRLRLVDVTTTTIIAETINGKGIAQVYEEWLRSGLPEAERVSFYLQTIRAQMIAWSDNIKHVPIVISGMASSTIGACDVPYATTPFAMHTTDLQYKKMVEKGAPVLIISGLRSDTDVMRGEETMLLGCAFDNSDCVAVLPGTHSKHAYIKQGCVHEIKTYMTGEFFELLSTKSILANSVAKNDDLEIYKQDFIKGVEEGARENLLNAVFHVRINSLLKQQSKAGNYYFLSGILIGAELSDVQHHEEVHLICNALLQPLYKLALEVLHAKRNVIYHNADEALIKAHVKIAEQLIDTI